MNCTSPPIRTVNVALRVPVFSKGGTAPGTSDIFVLTPASLEELAPLLAGLRATIQVENATVNFQSRVVFQTTSGNSVWGDGTTTNAVIGLEASAVSGNRTQTTAWYTTTSSFERGIRVGVTASQESGTAVVQAWVTLTIDFLLRS